MRLKSILLFAAKFAGTYTLLYALYYFLRSQFSGFEPLLLKSLAICVNGVLSIFGDTSIIYTNGIPSLNFNLTPVAELIPACNGHRVYILFISLFPAAFSLKHIQYFKWIFISIVGLYIGNVLRISVLSLIYYYQPNIFPFTHEYLFQGAFYLMVLLAWYWSFKKIQDHE